MLKPALLLGTMILSIHAFAASIADLNKALNKTNVTATQTPTSMSYAGRDLRNPQVADASESVWEGAQTQVA